LARYRVLVLDRAALFNLAADRFQRALDLYSAEMPLLDATASRSAVHTRLTARLARAAAALGAGHPQQALDDLGMVDSDLNDSALGSVLRWPNADPEHVVRTYRVIAAGLRANANQALGQLKAASQALSGRRDLFVNQLARSDRDEHLREVTLVEARLADNAAERDDLPGAARWIGRALDHADSLVNRTHSTVSPDQLAVLHLAGELGARAHAPLPFDLSDRLHQAHAKIVDRHNAAWRSYQRWFEIYLTLMTTPASR